MPILDDKEHINVLYPHLLTGLDLVGGGTPLYYSVPCSIDLVADTEIRPLEDWRYVIDRHDTIVVCPCCCSMRENTRLGADIPPIGSEELSEFTNIWGEGHHLERCFAFGEEAEYYLAIGAGRQVSKEEAIAIMERNIDEGLVVQLGYTNNSEIICSCHSDCCGVLGTYFMTDEETWEASPIKQNASNYLLQYDKDACLQCGMCASRCPMHAISMDSGYPKINTYCVRCGQRGLVCPANARTLTARDLNDRLPVPDNHIDDHNHKFGYRLQHGLV